MTLDYIALAKARSMPDHPTAPAKMSGGDQLLWDIDMELWDLRTVYKNPHYKDSLLVSEVSGCCCEVNDQSKKEIEDVRKGSFRSHLSES
jgi:hypothetical protein